MTDRVTKQELISAVAKWREITGLPLVMDWSYGRPSIEIETGHGGTRVLSPRLSTTKMREWLYTFTTGWEYGNGLRHG